jgi:type II secretion system protein N
MKWRWPAIAVGIPATLLLFVIFVIIFIPTAELEKAVAGAFERAGYTFRAKEFGKAWPLGIKARDLEIADERGALLSADSAAVRLSLLPLLAGKVSFSYRVEIGKGDVTGDFSPMSDGETHVEMSHLRLEDIPFFPIATGAKVKGDLQAQGSFSGKGIGANGELHLEINRAEIAEVKITDMPLPDASYDKVRGALKVSNGKAVLESFSLQGEGLYVRLKGDFPVTTPLGAAALNLTLELMPKPDFLEKQKFVFLLLSKYLTSPGAYQIPIRGTLAKPAIQ